MTTPEKGRELLTEERTEEAHRLPLRRGDHEKFAHYAPKEQIMQALVEGTPVRALCGKLWVPSRDPERFPVCLPALQGPVRQRGPEGLT